MHSLMRLLNPLFSDIVWFDGMGRRQVQPQGLGIGIQLFGKNGFEHNNLVIFELKLHWVS